MFNLKIRNFLKSLPPDERKLVINDACGLALNNEYGSPNYCLGLKYVLIHVALQMDTLVTEANKILNK